MENLCRPPNDHLNGKGCKLCNESHLGKRGKKTFR